MSEEIINYILKPEALKSLQCFMIENGNITLIYRIRLLRYLDLLKDYFKLKFLSMSFSNYSKVYIDYSEALDINKNLKDLNLDKKQFNFKGKTDEEIFSELLKNEYLVLDIYSKLDRLTDNNLINVFWLGENPDDYFKNLNWLIEQEKQHIKLIKPYASDNIDRII